jgi:hypothetical protein
MAYPVKDGLLLTMPRKRVPAPWANARFDRQGQFLNAVTPLKEEKV